MFEWTTIEPKQEGQYFCQHQGYYVVGTYLFERAGVLKAGWYYYRPDDGGLVPFQPDTWAHTRANDFHSAQTEQ